MFIIFIYNIYSDLRNKKYHKTVFTSWHNKNKTKLIWFYNFKEKEVVYFMFYPVKIFWPQNISTQVTYVQLKWYESCRNYHTITTIWSTYIRVFIIYITRPKFSTSHLNFHCYTSNWIPEYKTCPSPMAALGFMCK